MAVAVVLDFKGATLDQYDQVVEKMDLGGKVAPGGISHFVTKTDDGFRVVDVWDDQATFEKFAEEKIGPIGQEVGMPNPPEIKFLEVHNYLSAP